MLLKNNFVKLLQNRRQIKQKLLLLKKYFLTLIQNKSLLQMLRGMPKVNCKNCELLQKLRLRLTPL